MYKRFIISLFVISGFSTSYSMEGSKNATPLAQLSRNESQLARDYVTNVAYKGALGFTDMNILIGMCEGIKVKAYYHPDNDSYFAHICVKPHDFTHLMLCPEECSCDEKNHLVSQAKQLYEKLKILKEQKEEDWD